MLELTVASFYLCISAIFVQYFRGHLLRYIPFLYVLFFIMATLFLQIAHDGLFYGKPDQYAYLAYGAHYQYDTWFQIANDQGYHNPLYWYIIAKIFSATSHPVECVRSLNFVAHLLAILYCYRTVLIMAADKKMALVAAYIFALSPTLLTLDLYILRDSLMLYVFVISFYNVVVLYKSSNPFMRWGHCAALLALALIALFFRAQLGFIVFILALAPFLRFFIFERTLLFIPFFIAVTLFVSGVAQLVIADAEYAFYALVDIVSPATGWLYFAKFLLYASGFGFLDPTTPKTFTFAGLLVQRLLTIDSLIFMSMFLLMLLGGRLKRDKKLLNVVIVAYYLYCAIYFYFSFNYEDLGLHARALLPFTYISIVFVLANLKRRSPDKVIHVGSNVAGVDALA